MCISGVLTIDGYDVERYHRSVSDRPVIERLDASSNMRKCNAEYA